MEHPIFGDVASCEPDAEWLADRIEKAKGWTHEELFQQWLNADQAVWALGRCIAAQRKAKETA